MITEGLLEGQKAGLQLTLASHARRTSSLLAVIHRVLPGSSQKSATPVGLTPKEMSTLPWPQLTGPKVAVGQPDLKDTDFSQ